MAMRVKKDENGTVTKSIGEKYGIILHTEELYGKQALNCHEAGLLKLSKAQQASCEGFVGVAKAKPTQELLHSSDNSHGKTLITIGTNLNHAPLRQQAKSSIEVNKTMLQFEIARKMLKVQTGSDEIIPYFVTLTYPNSNKGNFKGKAKQNSQRVSTLLKNLKDGAGRGNGLQLVGGKYLGSLMTRELTVNEKVFMTQGTIGLWNDHVHLVLFADKQLNIKKTGDVIFKRWAELNADYPTLNKGAFEFVRAFDPKNPQNAGKDAISKAMKEVIKYSTKPADLNMICKKSDTYSLEVFAELFNGLKGEQMRRRHGLLWYASNFLSKFDEFENAIRLAISNDFPDIVTQLSKLVYNHSYKIHGRYEPVYERELSADEILFHNRSLIEKVLVSDDVIAFADGFVDDISSKVNTEMKKVYRDVFLDTVYLNTIDHLLDKLKAFADKAKYKGEKGKAYDLGLLSDSIQQRYTTGGLSIDLRGFKNMVQVKRLEFYDLFDKHVAKIKGLNAPQENKAKWALFADEQGLNTNLPDDFKIELYACFGWSDDEIADYLGNALLGSQKWEIEKADRDELREQAEHDQRVKIINLLSSSRVMFCFAESFPIVLDVPEVKLNRPKMIEKIVNVFEEVECVYVSDGFELVALEESPEFICDSYTPKKIELVNPFKV